MDLSQTSRHNSPSNCSTFRECENGAENSLNFNLAPKKFIDTYTIKVEQDVSESCDEQIRNDDTNLQEIKSEPQFCITDENDYIEKNLRAAGCDVKIKTEAEDTVADESSSNLHHVPFASIDNENLQDEDQLQNEITSELIIKSENEWSDVEESRDNNADSKDENYILDLISEATENKTSAADFQAHVKSECEIGRQVDAENLKCTESQISSYTCQICGRMFQRKGCYNRHLKTHEFNYKGLYECKVCKKKFDTSVEFSIHKKIHLNKKNVHKCLQCDKEFKSKQLLNQHVKRVHEAVHSFNCTLCSKSFKSNSNLKNHLAIHSDVRPFNCDKCSMSFKLNTHLKQHKKSIHSKVKPFECKKCGKSFILRTQFLRHGRVHSGVRQCCEVCGKKYKSKDYMKKHMNTVHKIEPNFKCEHCDKKFKSKQLLHCHKRVHAFVRKFQCALCDMKCKTKQYLSRHMSVHNDVRPFSCDICAKSFKSKSDLKMHGLVHVTSYDFKCNLCDAKFKRKGELVSHIKYLHSDARPFKCNECEKSYKIKLRLRCHIAAHLNLRQFKCDKCDRSFNCKYLLKSHSVVHSDISKIMCHFCERKFKRKSSLKVHIRRLHM